MVQMPRGTGKTHLLAAVIYDWLKGERGKSVWIVAHRRELVEQIEETVARYGIQKKDGLVKVMSIQWLSRHWEDMKDERPSLIVIDEAHHALAETYKELWLRCFLYGCRASERRDIKCGRFTGNDCIARTVDGLPAKRFFPV